MKDIHICALYGLSATIMNITSKSLIANYTINPTFTLLLIQHCIVFFFGLLKNYNIFWNEFKECLSISTLAIFNILFGTIGLKYVNLPMYVALRKLCTAEIFFIDTIINKQPYSASSALGVLGISLGALIAGINDLTSDVYGYFVVFAANLMNALLLIQIRKAKENVASLKSYKQVYICSVISIPYTLVLLYATDEHYSMGISIYSHLWSFYAFIGFAGLLGVVCNLMLFKCANEISPMATSVTGNAKDIVSMLVGLIAFNDVQPTPFFVLGLTVSTFGAMVYSLGKLITAKVRV